MWGLGTEPGASAKVASAFDLGAFPATEREDTTSSQSCDSPGGKDLSVSNK